MDMYSLPVEIQNELVSEILDAAEDQGAKLTAKVTADVEDDKNIVIPVISVAGQVCMVFHSNKVNAVIHMHISVKDGGLVVSYEVMGGKVTVISEKLQ